MERDLLLFVLGQIITGAAIWGAIRADIRGMHTRMQDIKDIAGRAHDRLDRHIEQNLVHFIPENGSNHGRGQ